MRTTVVLSSLLISMQAAAQEPTPAVPPSDGSTPPAAAAASAPASGTPAAAAEAPAAKPDLVKQAFDIVEVQANTKANLEKAVALYETALKDPALPAKERVAALSDMSRAYLRIGDLETKDATKIAAYEKGRAAAQKGSALDPKAADPIFWDMANQACIGRTKGVMNSLFMLPELRRGLGRALELEPGHKLAKQTLGEIDHTVPGLVGGSDERSEKAYLDVLKRDPHFTATTVLLAKFYRDKGKKDEARKWAKKVIDGPSSTPHDWRKFDKIEAQKLLKELDD